MSKSFLNTFKTQNLKTSFFSYLSLVFLIFIPHNETVDDKYCIYEIASKPNCSPNPNYSYSTEPEVLKSFSELVVPVAFWGINQDDGSHDNPLTKEKIKESIDLLNHAFKAIKISFVFKDFNTINDSKIYWTDYYEFNKYIRSKGLSKDKTLNIYVPYRFTNYDNNLRGGKWSMNQLSVNMLNYNTGILPHEVGHIFGLSHTHSGSKARNCEHVTRDEDDPNYNANCSGDQVTDTNAMPVLYNKFHLINDDCEYIGKLTNCKGTPYQLTKLDISNFMGYTQHVCRSTFTTGQGIRVREFIKMQREKGRLDFVKNKNE